MSEDHKEILFAFLTRFSFLFEFFKMLFHN